MKKEDKNSKNTNYFSGGLAELIPSPTPLTYSFFKKWFVGSSSIGLAMKLLRMPYQHITLPILDLVDDELLINLGNEEKTLYEKTIFRYLQRDDIHKTPILQISLKKIVSPICLLGSLKILLVQSVWIAYPQDTLKKAKKLLETIPNVQATNNIEKISDILAKDVWPKVIAVGILSEFYQQLLMKEAREMLPKVNQYISNEIAKKDWFFLSVADQIAVQQGKMSFSDYMHQYGIRADRDYELTEPRWHEIPEIIKKRIIKSSPIPIGENSPFFDKKLNSLIQTVISFQVLRSEAKKKALIHIDLLRQALLPKNVLSSMKETRKPLQKKTKSLRFLSGKGMSVSQGIVTGIAKNITNNEMKIPKNTIGIFPNASPQYSIQFPKCEGIIFLKGGQTSHGSIVAREFKIPALIDSSLEGIKDGTQLVINGSTGEWKIE
ncbi:MAG TPA: PEP-utilizing enzyme [Candidatus Saccharimonadales bacterium]|nr:PEP-utilizing enzyme [Candidatus Saccharimonadales bacterium]